MKRLILTAATVLMSSSAFAGAAAHIKAIGCGTAVSETEFVVESRAYPNPDDNQYLSNPGILGTLLFEVTPSPAFKRGSKYCVWGHYIVPADGSEGSVDAEQVTESH